ncbi:hypothetical protein WKI68_11480 [Streptomyces sp. MS1.HAVA.3]|uniref:Alpha/beta hydrolase n=1 Tax=Streptomyces caledonius TaxID=3134107 RepID=A0ABU8U210_9ACTN
MSPSEPSIVFAHGLWAEGSRRIARDGLSDAVPDLIRTDAGPV